MRSIVKISPHVLFICMLFFISCHKEYSCEGCADKSNKPLISVAGPNQVITLPAEFYWMAGHPATRMGALVVI